MPKAVEHFLAWYLNPRARLGRGMFNLIFILSFLPVLLIKSIDYTETASRLAPSLQNLTSSMHNMQRGTERDAQRGHRRTDSLAREAINKRNMNNAIFGEVLDEIGYTHSSRKKEASFAKTLSHILPILIYLALIPIVLMRLRDMGHRGSVELPVYAGFVYLGAIVDIAKTVLGMDIGIMLTGLATGLSFMALLWLSMAKSERWVPPCERTPEKMPFE